MRPDVVASEDKVCVPFSEYDIEVDVLVYKQAWVRLLAKVYEVDPLVCPKCGGEMKVIAVIENLWDKYAVSNSQLAAARSATNDTMTGLLSDLGYLG